MIRVVLPTALQRLARVDGELRLELDGAVSIRRLLDTLEAAHPALRGTLRDHATRRRRAYVRFFACGDDLSHEPEDTPLPAAVRQGEEPFLIVGAIAGG